MTRGMVFTAGAVLTLAACGPRADAGSRAPDSAATTSGGTGTMGAGTGSTSPAASSTGTTSSSAGGTGTTSPTGAAGTMGDTTHAVRDTTKR